MSGSEKIKHSEFVTNLGWISIVFGGTATLTSLILNIKFHSVLPDSDKTIPAVFDRVEVPQIFRSMLENLDLVLAIGLVASVAILFCGIGLIKRKNWGRLLCIGLLIGGILWNLIAAVLMFLVLRDFPLFPPEFDIAKKLMTMANSIFVAAWCALLGWIIYKLCTVAVKTEFTG